MMTVVKFLLTVRTLTRMFAVFACGALLPTDVTAKVLTWDCAFDYRIDEGGKTDEKMELIFKVDTVSNRSFMEGNAGIVDVSVHTGSAGLSFTEFVPSGAVQTTTITSDGIAVHSRNTVIFDEIVAAQHFGSCDLN